MAGKSLIDLAASRLALRAPALRAATALTRPNQSAQRLPRGRHAGPTAMTVGPKHVIANDRVERGDHLAHHCHDRDFRLLMERLEGRIPTAGAHRRHVEHLAYIRTTTPDAPPALERAALERVWRNADQCSDLLATDAAELGQKRDQRTGQQRSDSRHGGEHR